MKLLVIGSSSGAHIKFNSPFVSGYHAELLLLDNGEILLTDKGSKNGTFLNDQRLQPDKDVTVRRGDRIRIADQLLDWKNVPSLPMPDISKIKEMRGIGTNFRNKHQIQGERVSRFHATLTKKSDSKWYIQDHSKNGTTVNGQPIVSNRDVKLKKGDKILCAGVPVPNPYGDGNTINYRRIFTILSVVLLFCGCGYGLYKMFYNKDVSKSGTKILPSKTMTNEEIYAKYENSIAMIFGAYHYRVSVGDIDLDKVKVPCGIDEQTGADIYLSSEVVMTNNEGFPIPYNDDNPRMYSGTGFYISEDGKIATNLHIVRPWLYNKEEMEKIADFYEFILSEWYARGASRLGAYIHKVKVEGVLDYVGILPNNAYPSEETLKMCREYAVYPDLDTQKDVAILQLLVKELPDKNCTIVNLNEAVVNDADIHVGSEIYTMGFPFGLVIQDLKSTEGIQIVASSGSVSISPSKYVFGFEASGYGGASGSPIFNDEGQLIGILSSGYEGTNINYAVKAVHLTKLLEQDK